MSKQIKYILIAIAVLVIVGLGYIFLSENVVNNGNVNNQPTNTNEQPLDNQEPEVITSDIDTSDWQTYRNEELGFEFKHPEDWDIKVRKDVVLYAENGPIGLDVGIKSPYERKDGYPYWIHIDVVKNIDYDSALEYFKFAHRGDRVNISHTEFVKLGVDDENFLEIKEHGSFRFYITLNENNYFEISNQEFNDKKINYETAKIISTFKFIK